jgi:hypothetical protein
MIQKTTLDLIKSVRVRGMFPDASQGTLSPDNILMVASEELKLSIIPLIMSVREKYYETYYDYAVEANKSIYDIPSRASGSIASLVQYVRDTFISNLSPLDAADVNSSNQGSYPKGFYFENDKVVIYPTPDTTQGTLRIRYYQRPSQLCQVSAACQVTEVDYTNSVVTVTAIPDGWSSGELIDFIGYRNPHTPYSIDQEIKVISIDNNAPTTGQSLSFDALPYDREGNEIVKVGDWIARAGYTPLPEVMDDFFPLLVVATISRLHDALGDDARLASSKGEFQYLSQTLVKMLTPRDQWGHKIVRSNWRNW